MSITARRAPFLASSLLAAALLVGCGADPQVSPGELGEAVAADHGDDGAGVELRGRGSFSCDFGLSDALPLPAVPPAIERDRMYMSARPGMITKHLPISFDATGDVFSGGRYLFDTAEHAAQYADWVENGYVLDGVEFLSRPYFLGPQCYPWRVVGARELAGIEHQVVMRTERFQVPGGCGDVDAVYAAARKAAAGRGLTAVWVVVNDEQKLAQLVYFIDRLAPADPTTPDFASLGALAGAPALGDEVAPTSWVRIFDRTQWILTDWFPFAAGDHGKESLWPYSPPFPLPTCGDGVCEPSRGETSASCPADCAPHCGNAVCDPGETQDACPSDCRL